MEFNLEEDIKYIEINKKLKNKLQYCNEYKKMYIRKYIIINFLKDIQDSSLNNKLLDKYEKIGMDINEIEKKLAYYIVIKNSNVKNEDELFNNIVQDIKYQENIKKRQQLFKKLYEINKQYLGLLYELEELEIKIATYETDKIKELARI